jgi:DNA-binding NarL/FixJ family response regulator
VTETPTPAPGGRGYPRRVSSSLPTVAPRVLVVEDNDFTRMTLSGALVNAGLDVVGETGSAAEAIRLARRRAPDAAMLDLDLGRGPSGIDLAVELRELLPVIGVVMLSSYEDPRLTGRNVDHMPAGTHYAVKGRIGDAKTLSSLIMQAIAEARGAATDAGGPAMPQVSGLTDGQIEVMRLIADGMSNAQIAEARFVSESSVERMIGRIATELHLEALDGANRRVLIAREYMRMSGWLPGHDD